MTGHLFVLAAVRNSATPPPTPKPQNPNLIDYMKWVIK